MTSMTTVCSLILALMLALSGGADVPEMLEMMNVVTVRNFEMDADFFGNEMHVDLPMEFQISSAVGANEGVLQFQINHEGDVLMPLHGRVVSDALQLAIGDSPHAYAVNEGKLREELDFIEEDQAVLDAIGELLTAVVESGLYSGEVDYDRSAAHTIRIMSQQPGLCAEESTTVEFGGAEYPAQKRSFTAFRTEFLNLLANPSADLPAEDLAHLQTEAAKETLFGKFNDFSQTLDAYYQDTLGDEYGVDVEIEPVIAYGEVIEAEVIEAEINGEDYLGVVQKFNGGGTDYTIEYIFCGEYAQVRQNNVMEDEDASLRSTTQLEYTYEGPYAAPETRSMKISNSQYSKYSEDYASETNTSVEVFGGVKDGLWDVLGEVKVVNAFYLFEDGGVSGNSNETVMPFAYAETLEADGSKTGHFAFSMDEGGMANIDLSFDINYAEVPYADAFAGRDVLYLDESDGDAMIAWQEEWSAAVLETEAVFEAWVESVAEDLGIDQADGGYIVYPDGSIEEVMPDKPVQGGIRDSVRDRVLSGEDARSDDGYDEWETDESGYDVTNYTSWAEVQQAFAGELADFTPPEGMEQVSITMFSTDHFFANFGEVGEGFYMDVRYYDQGSSQQYVLMDDGKLAPANPMIVECYAEGDLVSWLEFYHNDCWYQIHFGGDYTFADAEAVLAGFAF